MPRRTTAKLDLTEKVILRRARRLVEQHFTTGYLARDVTGRPVTLASPEACVFCGMGAVYRAAFDLGFANTDYANQIIEAIEMVANVDALWPDDVIVLPEINDKGGKEAVLAAFDKTLNG